MATRYQKFIIIEGTRGFQASQVKTCGRACLPSVSAVGIGVALRDHRTPSVSFGSTGIRSTNPTSTYCSIQVQQFWGGG